MAASSWSVSKAGKRVERDPDARRLSMKERRGLKRQRMEKGSLLIECGWWYSSGG